MAGSDKSKIHVLKREPRQSSLSKFLADERAALIEEYGHTAAMRAEASLRSLNEKHLQEREPLHRELSRGDGQRARELGKIYEFFDAALIGNLIVLPEEDRTAVLRAIQANIATRLKPPSLPTRPPRLWADRDAEKPSDPASFTRAVYGRWFGKGISRKHLRDLDPQLYRALSVWEHRHPEDRIAELPTLTEVIDQKIALLSTEFSEDELRKLGTTLQTRLRRMKK